jgi:hypothetical protein
MAAKKKVKKTASKGRKLSQKKLQKGTVGNFFVFGILALLMVLGITAVGGLPSQNAPTSGQVVNVITPTPGQNYNNLQLKSFGYVTIAPTPLPPTNSLCNNRSVNTEPGILAAYYPGTGQTVAANGQIKVWVNDERPPYVAPNEQINLSTGAITQPGDRTAKASDNYLYEPALYLDGATVEANGSPHFPDFIKGQFNNNPTQGGFLKPTVVTGPKYDPLPAGSAPVGGPNPNGFDPNQYTAEYLWNVSGLGLTTGSHQAEFVIHDGDFDRAVGCVSIQIQ